MCLTTLDEYSFSVTFEARLIPSTSKEGLGMIYLLLISLAFYLGGNDFTSSLFNITLEAETRKVRTNLSLDQDSLVEGNYLNLTNNDPFIILNGDKTVETQIAIEDNTGENIIVLYDYR